MRADSTTVDVSECEHPRVPNLCTLKFKHRVLQLSTPTYRNSLKNRHELTQTRYTNRSLKPEQLNQDFNRTMPIKFTTTDVTRYKTLVQEMEPWSIMDLSSSKADRIRAMDYDQLRTEVDNSLKRIYTELEQRRFSLGNENNNINASAQLRGPKLKRSLMQKYLEMINQQYELVPVDFSPNMPLHSHDRREMSKSKPLSCGRAKRLKGLMRDCLVRNEKIDEVRVR